MLTYPLLSSEISSNTWMFILIGILVVALVLLSLSFFAKKKRRRYRPTYDGTERLSVHQIPETEKNSDTWTPMNLPDKKKKRR